MSDSGDDNLDGEGDVAAAHQGHPQDPEGHGDDDANSAGDSDGEDDKEKEEGESESISSSTGTDEFPFVGAPGQYLYEERMKLTEQERRWALAIKDAVAEETDMERLSDFWYANLAIVDKDNVSRALCRVRALQAFHQEYDFVDSWQSGTEFVKEFMKVMPRFWLALSYNARDQNYVLALDAAGMYCNHLERQPQRVRYWLVATYFCIHSMNPDLTAIRKGCTLLMENEGFDLKRNFGFEYMRRVYTEVASVYPYTYDQVKNFNTNLFFNLILSMLRAIQPKEHARKMQRGCSNSLGRLDAFYANPNIEAANAKFQEAVMASLQWRFYCESKFTLDETEGD